MSWRDVRDQLTPAERAEAVGIRRRIRGNQVLQVVIVLVAAMSVAYWLWWGFS